MATVLLYDERTVSDCGGYLIIEKYGFHTLESHQMAKIGPDGIKIDGFPVYDSEWFLKDYENKLPRWYMFRKQTEKGIKTLLSGLDLMPDGTIWCGENREKYTSIEPIISLLMEKYSLNRSDIFLTIEEPINIGTESEPIYAPEFYRNGVYYNE